MARQHRQRWDEGVAHLERKTFDAFLKLPAPQRKLIREVILTFAKVHGHGHGPGIGFLLTGSGTAGE